MNRWYLFNFILLIGFAVLLTSCAKEEEVTIKKSELVLAEQTPVDFLANQSLPAIMFSYNVFIAETNDMSNWLIDTEGNIRHQKLSLV